MDSVTIVIPVYNGEKYIFECINSIISQTYKEIEIIIIDDQSNDRTEEICKKYALTDKRIKYLKKNNGGVSSARNLGIQLARGKWTYFVDADDWIEKNAIEIAVKKAIQTNADLIIENTMYHYQNREMKKEAISSKISETKVIENLQLNILYPLYSQRKCNEVLGEARVVWGKLYKTELIKRNKIRFREDIWMFEDGIFLLNVLEKTKKIAFINEYSYHYRMLEDSATKRFKENYIIVVDNILREIKEFIHKYHKDIKFEQIYQLTVCEMLSSTMERYFFNVNNKLQTKLKREQLENKLKEEIYKKAIIEVDKNYLSNRQKLLFFLLKNKAYHSIEVLYSIKNRLIKRKLEI